jgi:predicted nicotinamide N-methyase
LQHQQQPFAASGAAERSGGLPAASHSLQGLLAQQQQQLQKPQAARRVIDAGTAAGLQAAAAAVAGQLKLLAAQQGEVWVWPCLRASGGCK